MAPAAVAGMAPGLGELGTEVGTFCIMAAGFMAAWAPPPGAAEGMAAVGAPEGAVVAGVAAGAAVLEAAGVLAEPPPQPASVKDTTTPAAAPATQDQLIRNMEEPRRTGCASETDGPGVRVRNCFACEEKVLRNILQTSGTRKRCSMRPAQIFDRNAGRQRRSRPCLSRRGQRRLGHQALRIKWAA
jgi:hypothetical protein